MRSFKMCEVGGCRLGPGLVDGSIVGVDVKSGGLGGNDEKDRY